MVLEKQTNEEKDKIMTGFMIDVLKQVLDGNIFEFNSKLWQQKIATAMGTKVGPTYTVVISLHTVTW